MSQGKKNHKLLIQAKQGVRNEYNQVVDIWTTAMERWGNYSAPTGRGAIRNAALEGVPVNVTQCSWNINYTPEGITQGMRVNKKGVLYDIVGVHHDHNTKKDTYLVCTQGGNHG